MRGKLRARAGAPVLASGAMRELDAPRALGPDHGLVIGAFDGMHRGHQALLACAAESRAALALLTFEPHPAAVLAPDRAPPRLQSAAQRARICADLGVDTLVTLPFDREVAATAPADFVTRYLVEGLKPARVVVGEDFRYGKGAAGRVADLRAQLDAAGIDFAAVAQIDDDAGRKLGSSAVREHVAAGEVEAAAELLGYAYAVSGEVVHGEARGRTLGYPTANLAAENLLPRNGVYFGWASAHARGVGRGNPHAGLVWPAVANVGTNPTFNTDADAPPRRMEVHLIDAELGESLYGLELEFSILARVRDELRFDSAEALRAAMDADLEAARRGLAQADPGHRRPPALRKIPTPATLR